MVLLIGLWSKISFFLSSQKFNFWAKDYASERSSVRRCRRCLRSMGVTLQPYRDDVFIWSAFANPTRRSRTLLHVSRDFRNSPWWETASIYTLETPTLAPPGRGWKCFIPCTNAFSRFAVAFRACRSLFWCFCQPWHSSPEKQKCTGDALSEKLTGCLDSYITNTVLALPHKSANKPNHGTRHIKPNQTKPNQTKPNQTKPNQTKPNQTKPNQTKP